MFVSNQVKTNAYFEICIYSYFHASDCLLLFSEQANIATLLQKIWIMM
jgi:hypothetical protein